jgi:hypothetical protein
MDSVPLRDAGERPPAGDVVRGTAGPAVMERTAGPCEPPPG